MPNVVFTDNMKFDDEYIARLANHLKNLSYPVAEPKYSSKIYIPADLTKATHVWVRVDRLKKSLEAPYKGPFKVVEITPKLVKIQHITGKEECISIQRVKPAKLPDDKKIETRVSSSQKYIDLKSRRVTFNDINSVHCF